MQFRSVAFVLAEIILRELSAKVTHDPVARDLGDHAGGSNAQADAITVDDGRLRKWKRDHRQPVNQDVVGRLDQCFDGQAHGAMARAQNVDSIDLDGINNTNSPSDFGISYQLATDFLAQFRSELFRIVQATMTEFFGENHCGRDDWARQCTPARLVNSSDARDSDGAQFSFVTKSAAPIHRQKLSADCTNFHRNFLRQQAPSGNLRNLWIEIRVTRAQPSLPCLCDHGDNSASRDARGLVAPLLLLRSAASGEEKPSRRLRRRKSGAQ